MNDVKQNNRFYEAGLNQVARNGEKSVVGLKKVSPGFAITALATSLCSRKECFPFKTQSETKARNLEMETHNQNLVSKHAFSSCQ